MSEKKEIRITKAQRFADIKALLTDEEVKYGTTPEIACDVLDHEIELLARKNSSDKKKLTAVQQENEKYKVLMAEYLKDKPDGATCTEVLKGIPEMYDAGYSNQKVSALFRQMKLAGEVESKEVKGKTYFYLV